MANVDPPEPHFSDPEWKHWIQQHARRRWFEKDEICKIIRNHGSLTLSSKKPKRPAAGSWFLFHRARIPSFRDDGYDWEKRPYPAKGEAKQYILFDNTRLVQSSAQRKDKLKFERRCYWIQNEPCTDIIFAHYRVNQEPDQSVQPQILGSQGVGTSAAKVEDSVQAAGAMNDETPSKVSVSSSFTSKIEDERGLELQLAQMIDLCQKSDWSSCSIKFCAKCGQINDMFRVEIENKNHQGWIWDLLVASDHTNENATNELGNNFRQWLICVLHEGGDRLHKLDNKGQGIIHLTAALGYVWAMDPIVAAGVDSNFRDTRGRTALHWASLYGRVETAAVLLNLGAAPGAVDDPTRSYPGGQTAADLASSRGHKGMAGFLAEADLIRHLIVLNKNENAIDSIPDSFAAENHVINTDIQNCVPEAIKDLSMKVCLAAIRKSASAASIVEATFRTQSFCYQQLTKSNNNPSGVSLDLVALGFLRKVQKKNYTRSLHSASTQIRQEVSEWKNRKKYVHFLENIRNGNHFAEMIQTKYRGWRDRKIFLQIRKHIGKIMVRARIQHLYKKVLWSVSMVVIIILRWRRGRRGLRGFRGVETIQNVESSENEYEFLQRGRIQKSKGVSNARAIVQSMLDDEEARAQYLSFHLTYLRY